MMQQPQAPSEHRPASSNASNDELFSPTSAAALALSTLHHYGANHRPSASALKGTRLFNNISNTTTTTTTTKTNTANTNSSQATTTEVHCVPHESNTATATNANMTAPILVPAPPNTMTLGYSYGPPGTSPPPPPPYPTHSLSHPPPPQSQAPPQPQQPQVQQQQQQHHHHHHYYRHDPRYWQPQPNSTTGERPWGAYSYATSGYPMEGNGPVNRGTAPNGPAPLASAPPLCPPPDGTYYQPRRPSPVSFAAPGQPPPPPQTLPRTNSYGHTPVLQGLTEIASASEPSHLARLASATNMVTPTPKKAKLARRIHSTNSTNSNGSNNSNSTYSRKKKSLGVLADNFLKQYQDLDEGSLVIVDEAAVQLGVERRRIYDVVNILESICLVSKTHKNTYAWMGMDHLDAVFGRLQAQAIEDYPEDAKELLGVSDKVPTEFVPIPLKPPRKVATNKENRSLAKLSQEFLQVFLVGHKTLSLPEASDKIQGMATTPKETTSDDKEAKAAAAKGLKTKIRRLYDIANVFLSVGLLQKVDSKDATRRPNFSWAYKNSAQALFDLHHPSAQLLKKKTPKEDRPAPLKEEPPQEESPEPIKKEEKAPSPEPEEIAQS